jgi:RHH-type proline utilization regulon transcriptional repressor/proline dehydrogenase/delta 1-pyrroline-5-carboxylate dehydrogenase
VHPPAHIDGPLLAREDFARALDQAAGRQAAWDARADRLSVLEEALADAPPLARDALTATKALDADEFVLPGPTGESNRMTVHPRGTMLCLGPDIETALAQAAQALAFGNAAVIACPDLPDLTALTKAGAPIAVLAGRIDPDWLAELDGFAGVACAGDETALCAMRRALARRDGPILPLITDVIRPDRYFHERHLCVDTTAAGGNAALLAQSA